MDYRPDVDQLTPGVILDGLNFVPTQEGNYRGFRGKVDTGYAALAATCTGAFVAHLADDSVRVFAGTTTKLYEANSGGATWTDRTHAAGNYTGTNWRFAQLGDTVFACNKSDALQSSAAGVFVDVAGAPKALIPVALSNGAIAFFNINDGSDKPNYYHIFDVDATTYAAPADTNLAFQAPLKATQGPITAAARFNDGAIVFKRRGMYLVRFVGTPNKYESKLLDAEIGCIGAEAIIDIGGALIWVSDRDIWLYDGSRPRSITRGLRQSLFGQGGVGGNLPFSGSAVNICHDESNGVVYLTSGNGTQYCYNYLCDKWGLVSFTIEVPLNSTQYLLRKDANIASGLNTASLACAHVAFSTDHKLYVWGKDIGTSPASDVSIKMNVIGDGDSTKQLMGIIPRFRRLPVNLTLFTIQPETWAAQDVLTGRISVQAFPLTLNTTINSSTYKVDSNIQGRYIRANITAIAAAGNWELIDVVPLWSKQSGKN